MNKFDPAYATVTDISAALADGAVSSIEITESIFSRVERIDPHLNAFVCMTPERAMQEAANSDARRARGDSLGPLDGVPYAVKDIFDVAGVATMAGSQLLRDNIAEKDCTAVRCLTEAGMVMIGKTHTVQFASSINGTNSELGTPHNPWHREAHLPGGSSSGSAVAVAAGIVPVALGSDTAGSIRVPAALTGITGFKPTCGRLGRGGVRPLSWSLDTVGPLARTARDAAMVFEVLQGIDSDDETTWVTPKVWPGKTIDEGIEGLHIAVCDTVFFDSCEPQIAEAVDAMAQKLAEIGATVSRKSIPVIEEASQRNMQGIIFSAEAYSVNQKFYDHHRDELDPVILHVEEGRDISVPDYYQELRKRFDLQSQFKESMAGVHAILAPTAAQTAWPLEKLDGDEAYSVPYSRNTGIGNYLNLASVSIPCGFDKKGLPIGAMISVLSYEDEIAFRVANAYQNVTDWHIRHPDLSWI